MTFFFQVKSSLWRQLLRLDVLFSLEWQRHPGLEAYNQGSLFALARSLQCTTSAIVATDTVNVTGDQNSHFLNRE